MPNHSDDWLDLKDDKEDGCFWSRCEEPSLWSESQNSSPVPAAFCLCLLSSGPRAHNLPPAILMVHLCYDFNYLEIEVNFQDLLFTTQATNKW